MKFRKDHFGTKKDFISFLIILVMKNFGTISCATFDKINHEDSEKRGGCGVVARERHESHMSQ